MMDDQEAGIHEKLVWALRWIAAEPEAAIAALGGRMDPVEIALTLEDWWLVIKERETFDAELQARISEMDATFQAISGPDQGDHWTDDAVRSDPIWATQRDRARLALALMGEHRDDDGLTRNA